MNDERSVINTAMKGILTLLKSGHYDIVRVGVVMRAVGVVFPAPYMLHENMIFNLKGDIEMNILLDRFTITIMHENHGYQCVIPYSACNIMQGKKLKGTEETERIHIMNFAVELEPRQSSVPKGVIEFPKTRWQFSEEEKQANAALGLGDQPDNAS